MPITPPIFKAFTLKTSQTCQPTLRHGIILAPLTLFHSGLGTEQWWLRVKISSIYQMKYKIWFNHPPERTLNCNTFNFLDLHL